MFPSNLRRSSRQRRPKVVVREETRRLQEAREEKNGTGGKDLRVGLSVGLVCTSPTVFGQGQLFGALFRVGTSDVFVKMYPIDRDDFRHNWVCSH